MPAKKAKPDQSKRILKAAEKVKAYRAYEAGTVAVAHQEAAKVVKLLADAHAEADVPLQREIGLLMACLQRFRDRVHVHVQAKTGALHTAVRGVDQLERLLHRADRPGYGVVEMARRAQADANRVAVLKASLQVRAREMAFVLAELEQLVDPLPGLLITSAASRKKSDKLRKERVKDLKAHKGMAPHEGSETSTLSYGVSAHAFYQNPQIDPRDEGHQVDPGSGAPPEDDGG